MELNYQVCSLELSKRLKELGAKQASFFWWSYGNICGWYIKSNSTPLKEDYSAFTVAELGEMLPEDYISCKTAGVKYPNLEYKKYLLCYYDYDGCDSGAMKMEETEANARAKMLIYLLEKGLMKND